MKDVVIVCLAIFAHIPLLSCVQLFDTIKKHNTVELQFPLPHPAIAISDNNYSGTWTVQWYTSDGRQETIKGCKNGQKIQLQSDFFTPIIAYEEQYLIPSRLLSASGALYPQHCRINPDTEDSFQIQITRIGGVSATCVKEAFMYSWADFTQAHTLLSGFNWDRFESHLASFSSPENLDRAYFLEAILSGSVKIYDIKEKKTSFVDVTITHPSLLDGEKILLGYSKELCYSKEYSKILDIELPLGQSILFTANGFITVYVQKNNQCSSFFSPYLLKDTS